MAATDDFREAARVLRAHAAHAEAMMPSPWRVVLTDSESFTGVASCGRHVGDPQNACDACTTLETYSEWVAPYLATVGPLVGLALADTFDALAKAARLGDDIMGRVGYREAHAVARLILAGTP